MSDDYSGTLSRGNALLVFELVRKALPRNKSIERLRRTYATGFDSSSISSASTTTWPLFFRYNFSPADGRRRLRPDTSPMAALSGRNYLDRAPLLFQSCKRQFDEGTGRTYKRKGDTSTNAESALVVPMGC